jgi:hypothetical protein
MSALSIQPTFPIFTETNGLPLENGYIWIGAANLDPQGNPISVYWDAALTIPAAQPIRTINGYPSRNGTPARLYVDSDYSIRVQNSNGSLVYSAPQATERYSDVVVGGVNAEDVIYDPPFLGGVQTNAEAKFAQTVSVKDFGAVGDGVTDDTAAIQLALDSGALAIYFPGGSYLCGGLTVPATVQRVYGEGLLLANANGVTVMQVLTDVTRVRTKDIDGLRFNGNSKTGATGIKFGSVTNNPSPGAQEAVLYLAMRDTSFRAFDTAIDSRVSMEHHYDNVVCYQNTVGMKLYSDPTNGGCNANTFTCMRFEQNTVGVMVVSNSPFPLHNNLFLGCIWQSNSVCGFYSNGNTSSNSGIDVKSFHVEGNGTGAATVVIDGFTVKKSDFHFVKTTAVLEDCDLSTALNPSVIAETSSKINVVNLTSFGSPFNLIYGPDATSQIYESGFCPNNGTKIIESYGFFNSINRCAVIGSPKMNLGFYRNNSTMANPAIPTLNNTTGAVATSITKDPNLGLMSSIQFATSPGSTATNRNYWNNGDGTTGDLFLFSVICVSSADTAIRFQTLLTGAFTSVDVNFVAGVPKRIVVCGVLSSTQGLQVYTYPTDSVGATLSFKAHEYVLTTDISVLNDVYQNGLCGVKTLNYEQLSAPPASGTWNRNDVVWNSAAASGQPPGWVCTVSGTPGTWAAMANLV